MTSPFGQVEGGYPLSSRGLWNWILSPFPLEQARCWNLL